MTGPPGPGPVALEAGLAPGGLVVHYHVGAAEGRTWNRPVLERLLPDPGSAGAAALEDRAQLASEYGAARLVLVVYDGDTGRRAPIDLVLEPDAGAGGAAMASLVDAAALLEAVLHPDRW